MESISIAEKIEKKREELFLVTRNNSLTSRLALQYSKELDVLLNEYENLKSGNLKQSFH